MPSIVAISWFFVARSRTIRNCRAPSAVSSGPYDDTFKGSSVKVNNRTSPRTPWAAPILATQTRALTSDALRGCWRLGRSSFGRGLAFLARHRLLRVAARFALLDAGGVEETHHAVGRLRALGHPRLDLVHVELQPRLVLLRQQRIEEAQPLDEAAIA